MPPVGLPPSQPESDPALEVARVRAVYVFTVLIFVLSLSTVSGLTPHVDLGVFATLMGGLLTLLGLGSVVRLVTIDKRKDDD